MTVKWIFWTIVIVCMASVELYRTKCRRDVEMKKLEAAKKGEKQ